MSDTINPRDLSEPEFERQYGSLGRGHRDPNEGRLGARDRTLEDARYARQTEIASGVDPATLSDEQFDKLYSVLGSTNERFEERARQADQRWRGVGTGGLLTRAQMEEREAADAARLLQQRAAQRKADRENLEG
jgi:hypothetical protein